MFNSIRQYVTGTSDTTDAKVYLENNPNIPPQKVIEYIVHHYPTALQHIQRQLHQRITDYATDEYLATKMYQYIVHNVPEFLQQQENITMLSLSAPLLFWKYLYPLGYRVHHEYIRGLYESLNSKQQITYAELALSLDGYLLQYLPVKEKTEELCTVAVMMSGDALRYVPNAMRTDVIVQEAILNSASAMKYASPRQRKKFLHEAIFGRLINEERRGGFSTNDWRKAEWLDSMSPRQVHDLRKEWEQQQRDDASRWHAKQESSGW